MVEWGLRVGEDVLIGTMTALFSPPPSTCSGVAIVPNGCLVATECGFPFCRYSN